VGTHLPITTNAGLAARLRQFAELLRDQDADPFRVRAYEKAADMLALTPEPVDELFASGGREALQALPAVDPVIAAALAELLMTGNWAEFERLQGSGDPVRQLQTIPGIGRSLASRMHDELHIETLDDLEVSMLNGRLAALVGIGPRRLAMIGAALGARSIARNRAIAPNPLALPPVPLLLEIDAEYRAHVRKGDLPVIAPRERNPGGRPWLPILHANRAAGIFHRALFEQPSSARLRSPRRLGDHILSNGRSSRTAMHGRDRSEGPARRSADRPWP
jgi:putative hydrolase